MRLLPLVPVNQYVADAEQHAKFVRRELYDDIGWKRDHPVLLRIRRRFKRVSTKVSRLFFHQSVRRITWRFSFRPMIFVRWGELLAVNWSLLCSII